MMTTTTEPKQGKWREAYSESRAEQYDRFIELGAMNYQGALDAVLEMSGPAGDAPLRVLELGAGTGMLSRLLLERWPNAQLVAVDGSPEMLERAGARLAPYPGRVRLIESSFEDFVSGDLGGGSYDLVVSSFSLHHMDHFRLRECFVELYRRLTPGGRAVIADYVLTRYPALQHRYEELWVETRIRNVRQALGQTLEKADVWKDHEATKRAEGDNPAILDDLLLWLSQAGFVEVDCHWKNFCYAIYGGRKLP